MFRSSRITLLMVSETSVVNISEALTFAVDFDL